MEIDKGRLNGIIAMAQLLEALKAAGVDYELASFTGGSAANAIPTGAKATIVTDEGGKTAVKSAAAALQAELTAKYTGIEEDVTILVADAEMPAQVVSAADSDAALRYVLGIIDGVHTMSQYVDGLVESSSNLGLFQMDAEGVKATSYTRSSDPERFLEIEAQMTALAEECGLAWNTTKTADAWPYNPDNKLLPLVREIYQKLNGEPINEVSVHAGLECGTFAILNPKLNMISIGPDLTDVHSPAETLYLKSIPKTWHLLEGVLQSLPQA